MLVTRVRLPACAYAAQAWGPRLTCVEVTAGWAATCQWSLGTTRPWPDPGSKLDVRTEHPHFVLGDLPPGPARFRWPALHARAM